MRLWTSLAVALCVSGFAFSTFAEQQLAVPPPPPPPSPPSPPPPPERRVPNEAVIASLSSTEVAVADGTGRLAPFAYGAGLTLSWLQLKDDFPTGIEATAIFGFGDDGARLYDLGISIVGSFEIRRRLAVPFASVGLDLAAVRIPVAGAEPQSGVSIGVHGNVGVHGFLTDSLYWRGQVGYLGAGIGGLRGELALGYSFAD